MIDGGVPGAHEAHVREDTQKRMGKHVSTKLVSHAFQGTLMGYYEEWLRRKTNVNFEFSSICTLLLLF